MSCVKQNGAAGLFLGVFGQGGLVSHAHAASCLALLCRGHGRCFVQATAGALYLTDLAGILAPAAVSMFRSMLLDFPDQPKAGKLWDSGSIPTCAQRSLVSL